MDRALLAGLIALSVTAGCSLSNVDDLSAGGVRSPSSARCRAQSGCGPEGDCCTTYLVPEATFAMGRGEAEPWEGADADETPEHPRAVSAYGLDAFEVTVGRFRPFVEDYDTFRGTLKAGDGAHPKVAGSGWDPVWAARLPSDRLALEGHISQCGLSFTWTAAPGANETRPITCVDWYVAWAFCAWDGGWLPTEAEWELAASGGRDRLFPWGNDRRELPSGCGAGRPDQCDTADVPHVGTPAEPRGRWGHHGLGGGASEWTLDLYRSTYYGEARAGCQDCANLVNGEGFARVRRGGSWRSMDLGQRRAAARFPTTPVQVSETFGIRCARPPS